MGTRSITVVKNIHSNKIIEVYKQNDGYPEDFGMELQEFINSGKIVNGIPIYEEGTVFNGMECFAAQLIAKFKEGPGGIYLHSPTNDFKNKKKYSKIYGAEYYYEIDASLTLRCWDCYEDKEINLKDYSAKD